MSGFRIRCEFSGSGIGFARGSPGPTTAHLEWEVKPHGVPFDGAGIQSGAEQPISGGGPLTFNELASTDDSVPWMRGGSYRWRARVATSDPLFPNTAWFSVPGNNITEAKLRKPTLQLRVRFLGSPDDGKSGVTSP